MKYILLCCCLVACAFLSYAQVTPRNILGNRYSLETLRTSLIARGEWKPYPNTPDAWQQALPDSLRTRLIAAGEAAIQNGFAPLSASLTLEYVRTGDRNRYQATSFGRRDQLMDLVLAESIEGKGRFTDAILNGVWAICEESFWGVPAHLGTQKAKQGLPDVEDRTVDLFAAETAAVLALTDYLVGNQLDKISPLIRQRMYTETHQRIFEPLRQPERYGYLQKGKKVNNWNPWIMSNWMTATLLLEPDETRRSEMLHAAMTGMDLYLNGLGDDGGCDEGLSYWFAAGACVFDALELLHSATGGKVDVYREPLIRNMASYVYKMHIAHDYFVDFADADPTLKPDGLMLYRFGKRIQDDTLTQFGRWAYHTFRTSENKAKHSFHRQRKIQNLLTVREMGSAPAKFQDVRDAWFADVQVMTARSGKGLYVATHGGHNNESHNHNDVGDFIIYADGQPVVIDVGRGTYTAKTFSPRRYELWYTQSQYHNLPIINGLGQPVGRAFEAKNVQYKMAKAESSLTMNIAGAYPNEAGIQSWNRTVRLNRRNESVVVTDAYAFNQPPTSLEQSFMTVCTVDTSVAGQLTFQSPDHRSVVLRYDPENWQVHVETIPLTTPDDEDFKQEWFGKPIRRILLRHTNPTVNGQATYRFAFAKLGK